MGNELRMRGRNESMVRWVRLERMEDKKKMLNGMNGRDYWLCEDVEEGMKVVDYVIDDCEIGDDNGEKEERKRVVLFDEEGKR